MRIYLESLGCRLNYAEMAALGRRLAGAGHELAASVEQADLCVLNSCAVTGEAARQSRQLARRLARANPAARLLITGCYATLDGEAAAHLPNVVLVVGNERKDELWRIIEETARRQDNESADQRIRTQYPVPSTQYPVRNTPSRTRAFIKVQDGCRNRCTFCIVTVARGEERSRPIAEVVAEVNALHAAGYQEAVLTGVHLGGYGSDLGADLRSLVSALLAETTIPRLRLSSLEPFDLADDFFDLWPQSAGRLMPHLHLPAQSGSDAVLRRMARRNRVADFEALVAAARARIPGLTVTTDLIVGFPGETESDFAATVAFARRVDFAHMHIFPYSARAGTTAARFSGQVPEAERKRRARILAELDEELGRAVRRAFLGQVRPVLWESPTDDRPAGEARTIWAGLTDNYLRVLTTADTGTDLHNRITLTRLIDLAGDQLWGEIRSER
ncbi:MAG: tRNA (N(6)-L-threonylcarbamoyladenosine(37)-C(2))-methylthiotransferase MtaB [Anaerolineae bacterium]